MNSFSPHPIFAILCTFCLILLPKANRDAKPSTSSYRVIYLLDSPMKNFRCSSKNFNLFRHSHNLISIFIQIFCFTTDMPIRNAPMKRKNNTEIQTSLEGVLFNNVIIKRKKKKRLEIVLIISGWRGDRPTERPSPRTYSLNSTTAYNTVARNIESRV